MTILTNCILFLSEDIGTSKSPYNYLYFYLDGLSTGLVPYSITLLPSYINKLLLNLANIGITFLTQIAKITIMHIVISIIMIIMECRLELLRYYLYDIIYYGIWING